MPTAADPGTGGSIEPWPPQFKNPPSSAPPRLNADLYTYGTSVLPYFTTSCPLSCFLWTPTDADSDGPSRIKGEEDPAGFDFDGPARVRARTGIRGQLPAKDYIVPLMGRLSTHKREQCRPQRSPPTFSLLPHPFREVVVNSRCPRLQKEETPKSTGTFILAGLSEHVVGVFALSPSQLKTRNLQRRAGITCESTSPEVHTSPGSVLTGSEGARSTNDQVPQHRRIAPRCQCSPRLTQEATSSLYGPHWGRICIHKP